LQPDTDVPKGVDNVLPAGKVRHGPLPRNGAPGEVFDGAEAGKYAAWEGETCAVFRYYPAVNPATPIQTFPHKWRKALWIVSIICRAIHFRSLYSWRELE